MVKKSKKIVKGMPSAVIASLAIHAAAFLLAGALVVFTVVKKDEKKFVPPKAVERPKMNLLKPKVKVKKTSKPKPTTRIVTKVTRASMPNIQLPEMSGMAEGLVGGIGGFDLMPDLNAVSVFGSGQSIGSDFEGTFYDFKRDRRGHSIPMDPDNFRQALKEFVISGWKPSKFSRYYRSPKKLYATTFLVPTILSSVAPAAFDEADTLGYCWVAHYKGQLVHKDGITFRFWGHGDDVLFVRVDGKLVLNACWPGDTEDYFTTLWRSTSADTRKYYLGNNTAVVGDWITLEPGVPLDMEVMFGEVPGGGFAAMLVLEVKDELYERNKQGGPILPIFKTAEPSHDLADAIMKDLVVGEACVTNGPVFCDYDVRIGVAAATPETNAVPEEAAGAGKPTVDNMRIWTELKGSSFEAEYVAVVGDKLVLKNAKGKQIKIPLDQISPEDRAYVDLENPPEFNVSFTKQSSTRFVEESPYNPTVSPTYFDFIFGIKIKQITGRDYNHEVKVEYFAFAKEAKSYGDKFILLERKDGRYVPTTESKRSYEFHGKPVELVKYLYDDEWRGMEYGENLIVVTDERGKIIAHSESKSWLFDNLEKIKKLPVGAYMDETCTRTYPTLSRPTRY